MAEVLKLTVLKRLKRDLKDICDCEKTAPCGIKIQLIDDSSVYDFKCEITGPPDTPYEGGKFELKVEIPENYPFDPPAVKFLTKVWHANICSITGSICLDTLNDRWAASLGLRVVLLSIQVLLSSPESDNPVNEEAAAQFKKNPEMFNLTACHWTNVYAGGPSKNQSFDEKVRKIMDLGFGEYQALVALSSFDWDLEDAIIALL